MEEWTRVIHFFSCAVMKALSDTSQLEKIRNKIEWQKDLTVLYYRRYGACYQIVD